MSLLIDGVSYGDNWTWPDEFDWSPIAQSTEYTLTGALIVEPHERQAGRPITLTGEWLTRAQVEALLVLRDTAGQMTVEYRGIEYDVRWRHGDTPVEARELFDVADPDAGWQYDVTLRFLEV
jgi:hypothetical protein